MFLSSPSLKEVFSCPEESDFYAYCLQTLAFRQCENQKREHKKNLETIVEFGTGDGSPVIKALLNTRFDGLIHGFELNSSAWSAAKAKVEEYELNHQYLIHNRSFFDSPHPAADCLIANPPYLPAWDNQLYQPLLHGGIDGITVSKQLLSLGYERAILMVSSYSNPVELIDYALDQGYAIADFMIAPLPFGYYSCEPKVRRRIAELRRDRQAFYSENLYLLAGVLFAKQEKGTIDKSTELLKLMTAL